jgi:hypothetical protein
MFLHLGAMLGLIGVLLISKKQPIEQDMKV